MGWFKKIMILIRLKNIIIRNGIKQSWIAGRLGISTAYLSLILNGKRRLTSQLESDFDLLIEHIKGE